MDQDIVYILPFGITSYTNIKDLLVLCLYHTSKKKYVKAVNVVLK